jgi:hypothetical protein
MKALNLAIYTGGTDNVHKVTMTAEFADHAEAVRFHEGVAKLCKDASVPTPTMRTWGQQLLGAPKLPG